MNSDTSSKRIAAHRHEARPHRPEASWAPTSTPRRLQSLDRTLPQCRLKDIGNAAEQPAE